MVITTWKLEKVNFLTVQRFLHMNLDEIFCVWKCGCGCFSKYFSFKNTLKYFLFLKNYFLYQNIKII